MLFFLLNDTTDFSKYTKVTTSMTENMQKLKLNENEFYSHEGETNSRPKSSAGAVRRNSGPHLLVIIKLDGVGPVDNRPSANRLQHKAVNKKYVLKDTLKSANLMMNADLEKLAPIPMLRSQLLIKIK